MKIFGVPLVLIGFGMIVVSLSTALSVLITLYILIRVNPPRVISQTRIIERISTASASLKPSPSPTPTLPAFKYRISSPSAGGQ